MAIVDIFSFFNQMALTDIYIRGINRNDGMNLTLLSNVVFVYIVHSDRFRDPIALCFELYLRL